MSRLIQRAKDCDGRFCEEVALLSFSVSIIAIMVLSISQL